jgi:hypothetical protein
MTRTTDHRRSRPTATRYRSLSNFYNADPRRIHSREQDVGLWWREDADGPLHRAAWVSDTGELYLARLGPAEQGGGEVEVLAVAEHEQLESTLEGWREQCGRPSSLAWLRERAARLGDRFGEKVRVAQRRVGATVAATGAALATTALALELV